jgi:hypothetical protein
MEEDEREGRVMGCSKPQMMACPRADPLTPTFCFGCTYHILESSGTGPGSMYYPSMAKHINEFTTDELLAEIKRRMGT